MANSQQPHFIDAIAAAVEYWQRRTEALDDATIARLDEERRNLYRAVELGLKLPETWKMAAVVSLQAFDLVERRGYWRDWIPILEAAVARCSEAQQDLKCHLLNRLGLLYRQNRQLDFAIAIHQEAEALARKLDDQQALAEALFYLSGDYLNKRTYAEAERHGLEALAVFTNLVGADRWIAAAYTLLGDIARGHGDLAEAEARLTDAIARWRTLNQPLSLARALNDLANALWPSGKVNEAKACFTEAAALLAPTAYELDKTLIQINLGTLYYHQQQWDKAEAAFRRADSSYLRQSGHIVYQAHVVNNLGSVLLERGRPSEAEYYLRRALDLWQRADDDMLRGNTLGVLGRALSVQRQVAGALNLYEEAIELLKRYPNDYWAKRLLEKFALERQALLEGEGDRQSAIEYKETTDDR